METTTDTNLSGGAYELTTTSGDLDVTEVERRLELGWYCDICTCFCICLGEGPDEIGD